MPIDQAIANPTPIKINDPMETYGNFLKNSYLQSEIAKARQSQDETAASNAAWTPNAMKADNTVDFNVPKNNLLKSGYGRLIPALEAEQQKIALDQASGYQKTQEGNANQASAVATTIKNFNDRLGPINTDDPNQFVNQYAAHFGPFTQDPNMKGMFQRSGTTPEDTFSQGMLEAHQAATKGPAAMKDFIKATQGGMATAYKRTMTTVPQGKSVGILSTDEYGNTTKMGSLPVGMTDEQQAQTALGKARLVQEGNQFGQTLSQKQQEHQDALNPTLQANKALATSGADALTKELGTLHQMASTSPENVRHIDEILHTLDTHPENLTTGLGQKYLLSVRQAMQQAGMLNMNDPKVIGSQVYAKDLAANVLGQMRSQSAGAGRQTNLLLGQYQTSNPTAEQAPAAVRQILLQQRDNEQVKMKNFNNKIGELSRQGIKPFGMTSVNPIADYGVPQAAVDDLMKNPTPAMMKHFDDAFKQPGMAARMVDQYGGTPTGAAPLAPGGR